MKSLGAGAGAEIADTLNLDRPHPHRHATSRPSISAERLRCGAPVRGCRPQGCGRQAYREVFTASRGPGHRIEAGHRRRNARKTSFDQRRELRCGGPACGCRPQGCGRQAYREVFTASRGPGHCSEAGHRRRNARKTSFDQRRELRCGGPTRGCRPQGCGRQAYRDVFTASRGPGHRSEAGHQRKNARKASFDRLRASSLAVLGEDAE